MRDARARLLGVLLLVLFLCVGTALYGGGADPTYDAIALFMLLAVGSYSMSLMLLGDSVTPAGLQSWLRGLGTEEEQ